MRKFLIVVLCFSIILLCFAFPSFANESVTPRATPEDLTGYTVTIPAGWTCPSEYGIFEVEGIQIFNGDTYEFNRFFVGFNGYSGSADNIFLEHNMVGAGKTLTNNESITFKVNGGIDSDFADFRAWLTINNASFAYNEGITDLTGYTVTVPAGWSAIENYGSYSFSGNISYGSDTGLPFYYLRLGYTIVNNMNYQSADNFIAFGDVSMPFGALSNSYSFVIENISGTDASNPSLIQWFLNNNAIFEEGQNSTPETSTISAGTYHFKTFGNLPDIPDAGWSDGSGYTYSYSVAGKLATSSRLISFTALNLTFNDYIGSSRYSITFSVDTADGIVNLATYSASYGQIETDIRPDLKYFVFDEDLIGTYDDIEFIREFLLSGMPDVDTSATDNPWAYILEKIIQALQVDLFGYFSIWDIFTTICGIFIVTWLLKLLAGG